MPEASVLAISLIGVVSEGVITASSTHPPYQSRCLEPQPGQATESRDASDDGVALFKQQTNNANNKTVKMSLTYGLGGTGSALAVVGACEWIIFARSLRLC